MKLTTQHPILGCDLSLTSTGFVVRQKNRVLDWTNPKTKSTQGTNEQRISQIKDSLDILIEMHQPVLAVIEGPAWSRAGKGQITQLAELAGVIKYALLLHDLAFVVASPGTIKLLATGSGKADKAEMVTAARSLWGTGCPEALNDDVADAFHLARYGQINFTNLVEGT